MDLYREEALAKDAWLNRRAGRYCLAGVAVLLLLAFWR